MRIFILTAATAMVTSPAWAVTQIVPEMSAGPAVGAVALLVGIAAVIREKTKRK